MTQYSNSGICYYYGILYTILTGKLPARTPLPLWGEDQGEGEKVKGRIPVVK